MVAKALGWLLCLGTLAGLGHASWRCWYEGYLLESFCLAWTAALILWLLLPSGPRR
jgi:hypothetical protein